jgi:hypothetical protein
MSAERKLAFDGESVSIAEFPNLRSARQVSRMATDHIRYDILAQQALRGVMRDVLADAAKNGLPGEHHFYISFDTKADGVKMSDRLREQHPQDITIILQHQFWDLAVTDDHFEVGLSFNGVPEKLMVPFEAVKGFFDPSVQFGLQFETIAAQNEDAAEAIANEEPATTPAGKDDRASPLPVPANPDTRLKAVAPEGEKPSGEVVRLDRFRKK